jgi:hypothetical protein
MAKQAPKTTSQVQGTLIPKTTDPRAELFFYLGHLKGLGIESASRITELVIDLTAPKPEEVE